MLILGGTYGQFGGGFGSFAKWTPMALYDRSAGSPRPAPRSEAPCWPRSANAVVFIGLAAFLYQRDRRES
ncbi:hypothetical protein GXW82_28310 [Streptacidiphilus sp. 4-A2]|nr:hypothetical protein [Streptacidiphilus sp. 4-A2]